MDGQMDGADNNIPDAFSKKRGDNDTLFYLELCQTDQIVHSSDTLYLDCAEAE